jgi:intracellular septation protein
MKLLFDFFPIILFFGAYKFAGIYMATGVAIVATLLQIGWSWRSTGRIEPMQWVSLAAIVLLGGATIALHDETFIKWKPTVYYWVLAAILLVGQAVFKRSFLRNVMGGQIDLPDPVWRALTWMWVAFFGIMGAVNLWVAFNFSTDTWVNYKLFGSMGLMVLFIVAQALWLGRHIKVEE